MEDWEAELDNAEKEEPKVDTTERESEVIIKPKVTLPSQSTEPKENPDDYERKYQEKHKDLIQDTELIAQAVANITDDELRKKKQIELRKLMEAQNFIGPAGKTDSSNTNLLANEKEFIDLASQNAARINEAKRPSQFTYSYLKTSIDLLAPSLDTDKIDDLIKNLNVLFNKKRKEESESQAIKTKGKAKPTILAGKGMDRIERSGVYAEYGKEKKIEEDEVYEDDDFI